MTVTAAARPGPAASSLPTERAASSPAPQQPPPAPAVPKVQFTGAGSKSGPSSTSRFGATSAFLQYNADGEDSVSRGYLRCEATPIPGGARLHVESFHHDKNDKVVFHLLAEVLERSGKKEDATRVVGEALARAEAAGDQTTAQRLRARLQPQ